MWVLNKNKARRSFSVGSQRFNFVYGESQVPDSKQIKKYVELHPDLSVISKSKEEPAKESEEKKSVTRLTKKSKKKTVLKPETKPELNMEG